VSRRVTLFALWAVFAVASVSVGFAAAGLVSDPFTDASSSVADVPGPGNGLVTAPGDGSTTSPPANGSTSPSPRSTKSAGPSAPTTASPSGTASRPSTSPGTSPGTSPSTRAASATVKRGISTRGGYVSATCRDGLVSVGAAPAVWWEVDSMTQGRVRSARVRLQPSHDAKGERVEVTATCQSGTPAFTTEYSDGGGGDDGGSSGKDGGGDDSSGPGGG
jgi:hypothetical protein